jgi:hypothetical protein
MMRAVLTMAVAVVALAGCDKAMFDDEIRKAVRDTLKDPDSAQWGEKIVAKDFACIIVNAKGGAGGYTGREPVFLQKSFGSWSVAQTKNESVCAEHVLERMSAKAAANAAVDKRVTATVLAKLKDNGFLLPPNPKDPARGDVLAGVADPDCVSFANDLMTAGRIAGDPDYEMNAHFAKEFAKGLAQLDAKICKKIKS